VEQLNDLRAEFEKHEAVCEERWKTVFNEIRSAKAESKDRSNDLKASVESLHRLVWAGGGAVILFLSGMLFSGMSL
jgi:hypothetical protein